MMKNITSLLIVLFISSAIFSGCKKDKGDPPALPPAESMAIDFSNFASAKKSMEQLPSPKGTENSNWEYAATVAGVWKLIINLTLAVPVAAFEASVNQQPEHLSDKTWQWNYSVTYLNTLYKARLTGQSGSSEVSWKMYITREGTGGFEEFLWFEGTSSNDGTSGQWILNQEPASPVTFLQIDWAKTASTVGNIKYTYLKNDAFKNSYIEYGLTNNPLNAFYNIHYYNNVKFSDVIVEWNTSTHNGRVKSSDYLGDANWYCWDANRINTVCQ
jgi:hypothetical protein